MSPSDTLATLILMGGASFVALWLLCFVCSCLFYNEPPPPKPEKTKKEWQRSVTMDA